VRERDGYQTHDEQGDDCQDDQPGSSYPHPTTAPSYPAGEDKYPGWFIGVISTGRPHGTVGSNGDDGVSGRPTTPSKFLFFNPHVVEDVDYIPVISGPARPRRRLLHLSVR